MKIKTELLSFIVLTFSTISLSMEFQLDEYSFQLIKKRIECAQNLDERMPAYEGASWTMIPLCCLAGHDENWYLSHLLLDHKANPNIQNYSRDTPLHIAANNFALKTVKTLLSHGANANSFGSENLTPLHVICSQHRDVFENEKDIQKRIEVARLLIAAKANPNIEGPWKETPLFYVLRPYCTNCYCKSAMSRCINGYEWYDPMFIRQRKALILLLMQAGANPHIKNTDKRTALQIAHNQPIIRNWGERPWHLLCQELARYTESKYVLRMLLLCYKSKNQPNTIQKLPRDLIRYIANLIL